jgi:hypothetical protein
MELRKSECVDTRTHSVDLKHNEQLNQELEKAREFPSLVLPWNNLYCVSLEAMTAAIDKFVQGQVQVDEDRIVCGLERYRLTHSVYPPNLDVLVPGCLDELPRDIINGEPYHYRLNADGTFLLYSIGWNQVDDGGKVVFRSPDSTSIDYEQGDWVWPMVKWEALEH